MTLEDLGVSPEKVKGDEAWALCPNPNHPDNSPSWSINLETGEHFCFSCGWGGNYLLLVNTAKGFKGDEPLGEEWIRKHGGIDVARKKLRGEQAYTKKKAEQVSDADLALFESRIPMWALKDKDIIQESCDAYGTLWDPAKDAWILPVRDPRTGALMGWQSKSKRHFLNFPDNVEKSTALYGYHLLGDTAYLEESPLDCNRLWTYGVDGAVSGYGVHVSDVQMELICDRVKTLFVCLDNDEAGRLKEAEIWRKYRGRTRLMFANYDGIKAKDHGEMTPEEIEFSIENAISAVRFRP
jgi:DNA primase